MGGGIHMDYQVEILLENHRIELQEAHFFRGGGNEVHFSF